MRKKLIFLVLLLLLITTTFLFGCQLFQNGPVDPPEDETDLSWQPIESPTPTDVYNRLLSGMMNVVTDFSAKSLASSPILGADAKLKLTMSDFNLWVSFKGNYDNNNKSKTMFSLEVSTV
ncbi:MAG TPA: hypothetical protein VJ903_00145, partial [Clostridia bacterium]|nr:hypothetical protein [Clostridia bacterium]